MHRQPTGSLLGMILSHGEGGTEETLPVKGFYRLKDISVSSSSISDFHEDDNQKASKRRRFSFSNSLSAKSGKFVHTIPILMLFCFLVLFVCSHTPSKSDLAQLHGFKRSLKYTDSSKSRGDTKPFSGIQRGKFLRFHSLRTLQGISSNIPLSRSHRKMAAF